MIAVFRNILCHVCYNWNKKYENVFFSTRKCFFWWHMNRALCLAFNYNQCLETREYTLDGTIFNHFHRIAIIHTRNCHMKKVLLMRDVCFLWYVNALISIAVTICEIENTQFLLMEYFLRFHFSQLGWHNEWCSQEFFSESNEKNN